MDGWVDGWIGGRRTDGRKETERVTLNVLTIFNWDSPVAMLMQQSVNGRIQAQAIAVGLTEHNVVINSYRLCCFHAGYVVSCFYENWQKVQLLSPVKCPILVISAITRNKSVIL